jgi:hypothetical protein
MKVDAKSYKVLFQIVMITRSDELYQTARQVLIDLLYRGESNALHREDECRLCLKYEISCWIDGCYDDVVDELCLLAEESSNNSLPPLVSLFQAWEHCELPPPVPDLRVSSLLLRALQLIGKMSSEFTLFTQQVASKSLMYDTNPIPLAALIVYNAESGSNKLDKDAYHPIALYAKSLVQFSNFSGTDRLTYLQTLLQGSFKDDPVMKILKKNCDTDERFTGCVTFVDYLALLRQVGHLSQVSDIPSSNMFTDLFKRLLPLVIVVR